MSPLASDGTAAAGLSNIRQWIWGRIVPGALLLVGCWLWWMLGDALPMRSGIAVGVALGVAVIPPLRSRVWRLLERLRCPGEAQRFRVSVLIAIAAAIYLIVTGFEQGRDFVPKFHDEHQHLLQMQMLARGRLWMPQHPEADFFESFNLFVKPVYASIYWPGTALMYVPAVWLKLPFWLGPALASGVIVGLMYRIMTELFDGIAGLLAALLMLSLSRFRYLSLIVMSHTSMVLLGLLIVWAYLRWRRARSVRWAMVMGALIGWAAITRPMDALIYALPVGIAVALDLVGSSWRKWLATGAAVVLAALPLLSVQLIFNKGVTGSWTKTPYKLYAELYSPDLSLGFKAIDPSVRPRTNLPQRQAYFDQFTVPAALKHRSQSVWQAWRSERAGLLATETLPTSALLVLVPLGLLGLGGRRWVLFAVLPLFVAGYSLFPYLLAHYCVVAAPGMIVAVVAGARGVEQLTKPGGARAGVVVFVTVAVAGLAISRLPEVDRSVRDDGFELPMMVYSYTYLPTLVRKPALVLFTYRAGASIHEEPVYNVFVAWPDDAEIVRAHDLGPKRLPQIVGYYAKIQPGRHVYVVDRGNLEMKYLGTAGELAKGSPTTP